MALVLVSQDLMLTSRLEGAARALGATLLNVVSGEAALNAARGAGRTVIVVDLELPGLEIASFMQTLQGLEEVKVIAFGPHVRTEKLTAAQEAGCAEVVSRGKMVTDASSILQRFLQESAN